MHGAQRLFARTQLKAFLAEEVLSLMRAISDEAGVRVLIGDMVHRRSIAGLGFDEA
jgi:hypothetical protein